MNQRNKENQVKLFPKPKSQRIKIDLSYQINKYSEVTQQISFYLLDVLSLFLGVSNNTLAWFGFGIFGLFGFLYLYTLLSL